MTRYHRQILLPPFGQSGQDRLTASRVLLVGCGALGTVMAEQLVRAGVGMIRIVDRDIVELTNLQRQVLFDEQDVREQTPKAVAAGRRLAAINSSVQIEPIVADLHGGNVESLAGLEEVGPRVDLMLDGTDSVEHAYLLNDVAVKHGVPWVYGACVGMVGRVMAIRPPRTACLRCLFPEPPSPGELPTCDTAGVFSPVPAVVASLQTSAVLKLLLGKEEAVGQDLLVLDLWSNRFHPLSAADAKRDNCLTCGQRRFEFLEHRAGSATTSLCGRNAVQVRPPTTRGGYVTPIDLARLAQVLASAGRVERTPYLLRCDLAAPAGIQLTVFADGRLIVQGTQDVDRAKSLYARYIGA